MPLASFEIEIDRPISQVFDFLANAENDPKWRRDILEIKRISGNGVGARYKQVMTGPAKKRISADIEITDYRKDELISFRVISGPVRPEGRYVFTFLDGRTRVEFRLEVKLTGVKKLLKGMVQNAIEAEVSTLPNLKYVLESM